MHRDRHDYLWTQTEIGIFVKAPGEKLAAPVNVMPGHATYKPGDWIYEDPSGHIWIPIDLHGLWKSKNSTMSFEPVKVDSLLQQSHVNKMIRLSR